MVLSYVFHPPCFDPKGGEFNPDFLRGDLIQVGESLTIQSPSKRGGRYNKLISSPDCFPVLGDGHKPHIRGLYTHCKDSLLKVG